MSSLAFPDLPKELQTIQTRPLLVLHLDVKPLLILGATPGGFRRVGIVPSGTFQGERLSGVVLDGGSDWQVVRPDGVTTLDVRLTLKTNDGELIAMTYRGLRHGPSAVIEKLEKGEAVNPGSYYFKTNPLFETASSKYDWINRIVAIGVGHRLADGPIYSVFEIL